MSDTPWRNSGGRNMPPCGRCPDKKPACQDRCRKPEFLAWKEEKERIDAAKMKGREADSYVVQQVIKNRRKR